MLCSCCGLTSDACHDLLTASCDHRWARTVTHLSAIRRSRICLAFTSDSDAIASRDSYVLFFFSRRFAWKEIVKRQNARLNLRAISRRATRVQRCILLNRRCTSNVDALSLFRSSQRVKRGDIRRIQSCVPCWMRMEGAGGDFEIYRTYIYIYCLQWIKRRDCMQLGNVMPSLLVWLARFPKADALNVLLHARTRGREGNILFFFVRGHPVTIRWNKKRGLWRGMISLRVGKVRKIVRITHKMNRAVDAHHEFRQHRRSHKQF